MILDIGHRKALGNDLADGDKRTNETYGGKEFATHVKRPELSAYVPRGALAQGMEYGTPYPCGWDVHSTGWPSRIIQTAWDSPTTLSPRRRS